MANIKLTMQYVGTRYLGWQRPEKDGGNKTGRGKGWIAAMISRNRCIPFKEFIRRMDDR